MNYNTKGLLFVLQVNWCKSQRTVVKEYIVVHLVHLDLLFLVSVKKNISFDFKSWYNQDKNNLVCHFVSIGKSDYKY